MKTQFRKATSKDADRIWEILQEAIHKRKEEGSNQWQDGYPNPEAIAKDISKEQGFVMLLDSIVVGYVAMAINDEPAYDILEGKWLTNGDYVVFHRAAISIDHVGKGLASEMFTHIENYTLEQQIFSVKADTNFDNEPMLYLFEKFGYQYCGQVYFRGSARRAFEKVLNE